MTFLSEFLLLHLGRILFYKVSMFVLAGVMVIIGFSIYAAYFVSGALGWAFFLEVASSVFMLGAGCGLLLQMRLTHMNG